MRIEVKGRNVAVSDAIREHVDKRFGKVAKQVFELAELEVELYEERDPAIADCLVARVDPVPARGGYPPRARSSREMMHSINLCADEIAVQVKRHRDKRRKRRESRAAAAAACRSAVSAGDAGRHVAGRVTHRRAPDTAARMARRSPRNRRPSPRATGARQRLRLGSLQNISHLGGWAAHLPCDPLHQEIAGPHNYGACHRVAPAVGARCSLSLAAVRSCSLSSTRPDCARGYVDAMLGFTDHHRLGYLR